MLKKTVTFCQFLKLFVFDFVLIKRRQIMKWNVNMTSEESDLNDVTAMRKNPLDTH